MRLIDILEIADENKRLEVWTTCDLAEYETLKRTDKLLTFYDGKNSIDEKYNDYTVESVHADSNVTIVYIDTEKDERLDDLMETIRDYIEYDISIGSYFTVSYSAEYGGLGIYFDGEALELMLMRDCEHMTDDMELLGKAVDKVITAIYDQLH